jgi:hypothetical protein
MRPPYNELFGGVPNTAREARALPNRSPCASPDPSG